MKISSIETLHPFYIPFFIINIAEWDRKKKSLMSLVQWHDPRFLKDGCFTDYHHNSRNGCPYKIEFERILSEELQIFSEHINSFIFVEDIWAQRYLNQEFMDPHRHGSVGFSAVLYADFDAQKHEATNFIAPFNNFVDDTTLYFSPDVFEGMIILFPSMMTHYANPNSSTKPRTIFSMNINTRKKG